MYSTMRRNAPGLTHPLPPVAATDKKHYNTTSSDGSLLVPFLLLVTIGEDMGC